MYQISDQYRQAKDRQNRKIELMTNKSYQKFWALKWKFVHKESHLKIWSAKFFSVPPNSAPSLRPCWRTSISHPIKNNWRQKVPLQLIIRGTS